VLRYHGYSVLMCAGRRLAYLSACNVDFLAPVQVSSEEAGGDWRYDPRIPKAAQLGRSYYLGNDLDRGHLSRRNDLARGQTRDLAIARNRDSFFWTNCAPQHFLLNQSDRFTGAALQLWGDLEDHIADQGSQNGRLAIFNGPVFGDADIPYRDAFVPHAFYKIVAWNDVDGPGAVGFVLEQADLLATLAQEAVDPGAFSIRQRRIAAIGAELDLDLGGLVALQSVEILSVADIRIRRGG
jgi:endonuclease G